MIPATFAKYIRLKTRTNASTFTDIDIVAYANVFKDEMADRIIGVNERYFAIYSLASLVAAQREYALPDDMLAKILFVEAKLDGTNYQRLEEVNINTEEFVMSESNIQNDFAGRKPSFFLFRKSLYLMTGQAITDVTDGIRLWLLSYPPDFTAFEKCIPDTNDMSVAPTSTSHGWPRAFQELLARRVVIEWKGAQDKPITLTEKEQSWENDFYEALNSISDMNLDRSLVAKMPYNDGSNY